MYWPQTLHQRRVSIIQRAVQLTISRNTRRRILQQEEDNSVMSCRSIPFTEATLHPTKGTLKIWLDRGYDYWPNPIVKKDVRCQLHFWATGNKFRAQISRCKTCNVTLCIYCYEIYHTHEDLTDTKNDLQLEEENKKRAARWKGSF